VPGTVPRARDRSGAPTAAPGSTRPARGHGAAGATLALAIAVVVAGCTAGRAPSARATATTTTTTAPAHKVDRSLFAPGSCTTFGPTAGNRHQRVFLDAGHGGLDPGAVGHTLSGQTVFEADVTLPIELDTMALLRARGFVVTVSRTGASTVARLQPGDVSGGVFTVQGEHRDLLARVLCADQTGSEALVGIYMDAGASPLNAGCLTGYDAVRPFAASNLRLATLVQHDVLAAMNAQGWGIPDQGVLPDTVLGGPPLSAAGAAYDHLVLLGPADPGYVDTPSQMPGALVEPLFLTDPFEATLAVSAAGQQVIAGAIATAVEAYFDGSRAP
jgi:N-acetylmuramoyl-L-alanine amidase